MSTQHPLADLSVLDRFKAAPFPPGYPSNMRTLYAPVDLDHEALKFMLSTAQKSLVVAMFGYNDPELADIILAKLTAEHVYVQLTLDSRQAAGAGERKLLAREHYPASSVAIGHSEHGDIMHLKMVIIDGVYVITGSTNWSTGGEAKQDNQLTIIADAYLAAEARARIDAIHANMLTQQAK